MELLKKFFPYSFGAKDVTALVVKILVYLVVGAIAGAVIGFLSGLPVIGLVFGLVGSIAGVYVTAGIVIAILDYMKVLK